MYTSSYNILMICIYAHTVWIQHDYELVVGKERRAVSMPRGAVLIPTLLCSHWPSESRSFVSDLSRKNNSDCWVFSLSRNSLDSFQLAGSIYWSLSFCRARPYRSRKLSFLETTPISFVYLATMRIIIFLSVATIGSAVGPYHYMYDSVGFNRGIMWDLCCCQIVQSTPNADFDLITVRPRSRELSISPLIHVFVPPIPCMRSPNTHEETKTVANASSKAFVRKDQAKTSKSACETVRETKQKVSQPFCLPDKSLEECIAGDFE